MIRRSNSFIWWVCPLLKLAAGGSCKGGPAASFNNGFLSMKKKILIVLLCLLSCFGSIVPVVAETSSSNFITYLLMLMMSRGITFNANSMSELQQMVSTAWSAYAVGQGIDQKKQSIESGVSFGDSSVTASSESYYYASGFVNSTTGHYLNENVNSFKNTTDDFWVVSPGSSVYLGYQPASASNPDNYEYFENYSNYNVFISAGYDDALHIWIPSLPGTSQYYKDGIYNFHVKPGVSSYSELDKRFYFGTSDYIAGLAVSADNGPYYCMHIKASFLYSFKYNSLIPLSSKSEMDLCAAASNYSSSAPSIDAVVPGKLRDLSQPKSIDSDKVYEQQLKGILQGANSADQIIDRLADQISKGLSATIGQKSVSISYPVSVNGDYVVSVPSEAAKTVVVPTAVPTSVPTAVPTSVPITVPDVSDSSYKLASVTSVFPFCIPYDVYRLAQVLNVSAVAPSWDVPLKIEGVIDSSVHLGFDDFESVNKISRTCQVILFIIMLIFATRSLIGNG